ncbi:hypothetical protein [Tsukamurella sp. 1534]|uniref:hypothetical protein n=1 Tax=Tsukamurella sp. 1534 TaxID=1151061 RepID=UPI000303E3E8|nr:hypothetical protein [Tsukamurella sp. 1534]
MRTFSKSMTAAVLTAVALTLGGVAAANAAPDDYDYKTGRLGAPCSYPVGTLALEQSQGFVLTCTSNGTWQIPDEP